MNFKRLPLSPAVWLFLAAAGPVFVLYSLTLAPGVVGGDAGEHQLAVPLLGIPHTTGYPLYVLTGKLWSLLLPFGSPAWQINLFSALGGALAAGLTALVVNALPPRRPAPAWPGAIAAGLSLAWGLTLWQWSTIAGVRSFNIFFFALLTLLAIHWADQRAADPATAERTLRWLALAVGLSLAHHRTTVFYLPALIGWIWWHDRRLIRRPRRLLTLTLLSLLPLLLYAFIYIRGVTGPPYTHEQITNWQSFWFLVGSGDSAGLFMSIDPAYLPARLSFIWQDVLRQLAWPGVGLAALGGGLLLWRRPAHFLMQGLLVVLLLLFTLDFEVVNLNEAPTWYLMPAYFIFAVWLGLGVNGLVEGLLRAIGSKSTKQPPVHNSQFTIYNSQLLSLLVVISILLLLAATLARPNWHLQREQATAPLDDWRQLLRGVQAQRFVESSLPFVEANSIIWGDWEQYTPIKYYQLINGLRPDVTARNPLNNWPEKVAAAHAAEQPIYFTRKPADLIGTPHLSMLGPLIRVRQAPQQQPPPGIEPLAVNFEDELLLVGYQAEVAPQATPGGALAGPILQVMLYWQAPQKLQWDYALSLRLLDATGREVARRDAAHPVLSSYPTSLWTPGEVVGDYYELPLPPSAARPVSLLILPYRTKGPGQWYNLTPTGAETAGVTLGPFAETAGGE